MKILFCINLPNLITNPLYFAALNQKLLTAKNEVRILLMGTSDQIDEHKALINSIYPNADFVILNNQASFFKNILSKLGLFKNMVRFFKMYQFDLVHCYGDAACVLGLLLKIRFNMMLVWSYASSLGSGLKLHFIKWALSVLVDQLLVSSQMLAHELGRSKQWRSLLQVVYDGALDSSVEPKISSLQADHRASDFSQTHLVINGNDLAYRGYVVILTALKKFIEKYPNHQIKLTGLIQSSQQLTSVEFAKFYELVKVLHLDSYIQIKVGQEFASFANILISVPTRPEYSDPMVLKAMAHSVVVIGSRMGILPEYIIHETSGLLVEAVNAEALLLQLEKVIFNHEFAKHCQQFALQEAKARFDLSKNAQAIIALYQKLIPDDEYSNLVNVEDKLAS